MTRAAAVYFAVPDPDDATVMTYWKRDRRGLVAWPARASWGPCLHTANIPTGLDDAARKRWILRWASTVQRPWEAAVQVAIDADPHLASARFADLTTRCCWCGRKLVSPTSKLEAIGPECRTDVSVTTLGELRAAVSRAHAEALRSSAR